MLPVGMILLMLVRLGKFAQTRKAAFLILVILLVVAAQTLHIPAVIFLPAVPPVVPARNARI